MLERVRKKGSKGGLREQYLAGREEEIQLLVRQNSTRNEVISCDFLYG